MSSQAQLPLKKKKLVQPGLLPRPTVQPVVLIDPTLRSDDNILRAMSEGFDVTKDIIDLLFQVRHLSEAQLMEQAPSIKSYVDWLILRNGESSQVFPCFNAALTRYALDKYYNQLDLQKWLKNLVFPDMNEEHVDLFMKLIHPTSVVGILPQHVVAVPVDTLTIRGWKRPFDYAKFYPGCKEFWANPSYVELLIRILNIPVHLSEPDTYENLMNTVMKSYAHDWLDKRMRPVILHAKSLGWDPLEHVYARVYPPNYIQIKEPVNFLCFKHNLPYDFNQWKEVIDFVLNELEIPINHKITNNMTSLYSNWRYPERLNYLIQRGADVKCRDFWGDTPVLSLLRHYIKHNMLPPVETVKALLLPDVSVLKIHNNRSDVTPMNVIIKTITSHTKVNGQHLSSPHYELQHQWMNMVKEILATHTQDLLNPFVYMPPQLHRHVAQYLQPEWPVWNKGTQTWVQKKDESELTYNPNSPY